MKNYRRIFLSNGNMRQSLEWLGDNGLEVPQLSERQLHLGWSSC